MAHTSAGWVFLPLLGAPVAHGPVLGLDLAPGLKRPISTRLFGENKTWRGALVMTTGTMLAGTALARVPVYRRRLPEPIADANPVVVGGLLGLASWIGELPNSFIKRRIGIPPGQQLRSPVGLLFSIVDQADWVPAAALMIRPIWKISLRETAQVSRLERRGHIPRCSPAQSRPSRLIFSFVRQARRRIDPWVCRQRTGLTIGTAEPVTAIPPSPGGMPTTIRLGRPMSWPWRIVTCAGGATRLRARR